MPFSNLRANAMHEIANVRLPLVAVKGADKQATEIYGQYVFNEKSMKRYLSKSVLTKLLRTIKNRDPMDMGIANAVANGMKRWAIDNGATHFTHWFQPMTGATAEKHDSFIAPDGKGGAIAKFSGNELVKGEPDASSFPSGGIRATFEARGYTGWDPSSPAFLQVTDYGKTLTIPTIFCSYTGDALDKKTPLLRSIEAVSTQAVRILNVFGNKKARSVHATVGPEQEYFLIDRNFFMQRPDLIATGRTLFGAKPPKGQQMEDHYFGTIKKRVLSFMMDLENELFKLGVPVKTRHNEVAPAQYEFAPLFEELNIATDHNMLVMEKLHTIALKHGLVCLVHEKPFAGINGSGKHNNWSLSDSQGNNLLDPGTTPHENAQFLVFLVAVIRAVNKNAEILRLAVNGAGNDHRLGANEAPPAILSIFLGEQLTEIIEYIDKGEKGACTICENLKLGVTHLPELPKDTTDRNRTSPFAFTGNKFEFRAVGSSHTIASANIALNTIVAESLDYFAEKLEKAAKSPKTFMKALEKILQKEIREHKRVIFNGDNYNAKWAREAKKRKLPNLVSTPDALPVYAKRSTKDLFKKYGVLNEREAESRYEIMLENYNKTLRIEADTCVEMAKTMILPVGIQYQRELSESIDAIKRFASKSDIGRQAALVRKIAALNASLSSAINALEKAISLAEKQKEALSEARIWSKKVLPAMQNVRKYADELELSVDDRLWLLPKYKEMLFLF